MNIITLQLDNEHLIRQAAQLLVDAFRKHSPEAWPTFEDGMEEVREMLGTKRICRAAIDDAGNLLGIIGGIPEYDGNVWELHPMAVQPSVQGRGIGRALMGDFEEQVHQHGGLTIMLGTDDEDDMTTLSNIDLYENTWEKIRDIRNLKGHPFEFYQKMGYTIIGVMPDANGRGKPDIYMGKRIG